MSSLVSSTFIQGTTERAVKSFAQGILATFLVGDGFNAFHADWGNALGFGVGGAVLSVATSLLSFKFGPTGSPSLVAEQAGEDEGGRHQAR